MYREARRESDEGPFLAEERHLLDALAEMLQSALDRRLADERLRLLLNLTSAVTSELDLGELLQTISKLLREDIRHHFASVILWDEQAQVLRRHALVFPDGKGVIRDGVPVGTDRTPAVMAFRRRETLVFRWKDIEALGEPAVGIMAAEGLRSVCSVPLQTRRGCHGALTVAKPADDPFSADEILLLEQVAQPLAIAIENALAYQQISALRDRLTDEKVYLEDEVTRGHEFKEIVGRSRALAGVLHQVRTVAPTDATVLLLGETGTGKELVARAVHDASRRSAQTLRPRELRRAARQASSRASCSATRRARSPAPCRRRSDASSWRTAARCSSTRSARCRSTCSPSCCARCRSRSSSGSAAPPSGASTCG